MALHTQIFEMCHYGNGFTVDALYTMPTRIRMFYYKKLSDTLKEANKKTESVMKESKRAGKVRIRK